MRVKGVTKIGLRRKLEQFTSCALQHNGWPCGTCFQSMQLPDGTQLASYWHAVLAYRGDYDHPPYYTKGDDHYHMVSEIVFNPDGTFKEHRWVDEPIPELQRLIQILNTKLP